MSSGKIGGKIEGLRSRPVSDINGEAFLPGDKSVSHRALMLGALAVGRSHVRHLLEGEDVLRTAGAMRAMGARIKRTDDGIWHIDGVGVGGLSAPEDVLDMGNSGTSTRLLMGLVATHPIRAVFTGDASLRRRPMGRVTTPLGEMGAVFAAAGDGHLPLTVTGTGEPLPIDYSPPIASAQVKSAILLAALNTSGRTVVRESRATRDHSERMLMAMGAGIVVEETAAGDRIISLEGESDLHPIDIEVPGDISSAAFPLVAAAIHPGSGVRLLSVGVNPLRDGIVEALSAMGADITLENRRMAGGEPVADIILRAPDALAPITLDPGIVPRMIDEFPALFIAAACADGTSRFSGLEELRVKESDRIATMARGLIASGVEVREFEDGIEITGTGRPPAGGAHIATELDHRIAMSFLVLGTRSIEQIAIDDAAPIETSFPGFAELMNSLGADIARG